MTEPVNNDPAITKFNEQFKDGKKPSWWNREQLVLRNGKLECKLLKTLEKLKVWTGIGLTEKNSARLTDIAAHISKNNIVVLPDSVLGRKYAKYIKNKITPLNLKKTITAEIVKKAAEIIAPFKISIANKDFDDANETSVETKGMLSDTQRALKNLYDKAKPQTSAEYAAKLDLFLAMDNTSQNIYWSELPDIVTGMKPEDFKEHHKAKLQNFMHRTIKLSGDSDYTKTAVNLIEIVPLSVFENSKITQLLPKKGKIRSLENKELKISIALLNRIFSNPSHTAKPLPTGTDSERDLYKTSQDKLDEFIQLAHEIAETVLDKLQGLVTKIKGNQIKKHSAIPTLTDLLFLLEQLPLSVINGKKLKECESAITTHHVSDDAENRLSALLIKWIPQQFASLQYAAEAYDYEKLIALAENTPPGIFRDSNATSNSDLRSMNSQLNRMAGAIKNSLAQEMRYTEKDHPTIRELNKLKTAAADAVEKLL
ncbi:MAG: hypothetical protein JWO53_653 [Chlamydiia bacterium]|nr:hypothetical protein [Chlamydiia bacterium]